MAFNPEKKATWSVAVAFTLKGGGRAESEWSIVASSPETAAQRGIKAARRKMTTDKVRARGLIRRVYVSAEPDR